MKGIKTSAELSLAQRAGSTSMSILVTGLLLITGCKNNIFTGAAPESTLRQTSASCTRNIQAHIAEDGALETFGKDPAVEMFLKGEIGKKRIAKILEHARTQTESFSIRIAPGEKAMPGFAPVPSTNLRMIYYIPSFQDTSTRFKIKAYDEYAYFIAQKSDRGGVVIKSQFDKKEIFVKAMKEQMRRKGISSWSEEHFPLTLENFAPGKMYTMRVDKKGIHTEFEEVYESAELKGDIFEISLDTTSNTRRGEVDPLTEQYKKISGSGLTAFYNKTPVSTFENTIIFATGKTSLKDLDQGKLADDFFISAPFKIYPDSDGKTSYLDFFYEVTRVAFASGIKAEKVGSEIKLNFDFNGVRIVRDSDKRVIAETSNGVVVVPKNMEGNVDISGPSSFPQEVLNAPADALDIGQPNVHIVVPSGGHPNRKLRRYAVVSLGTVATAVALGVGLGVGLKKKNKGPPGGSWVDTCRLVDYKGNLLRAVCKDKWGDSRRTEIKAKPNEILTNENGHLRKS